MKHDMLLDKILKEYNNNVDSFIENTEAGKDLYEICYEVHESPEVSLYFELPAKGDYISHVIVYPIVNDEIVYASIVADIPVREYSKLLYDIVKSSSTIEDFRRNYTNYCQSSFAVYDL